MPFAVAGTVLGIGLVIAFNSGCLVLTGGWLIMVLAYVVRKLPFTVRSASAILHQIDPSLEEASINLGVSPLRDLPAPHRAADARRHRRRHGADLGDGRLGAQLDGRALQRPWTTMTVVMFQALEGTSGGIASAAATVLISCHRAAGGAGLPPAAPPGRSAVV